MISSKYKYHFEKLTIARTKNFKSVSHGLCTKYSKFRRIIIINNLMLMVDKRLGFKEIMGFEITIEF